jgi:hypothetical protein
VIVGTDPKAAFSAYDGKVAVMPIALDRDEAPDAARAAGGWAMGWTKGPWKVLGPGEYGPTVADWTVVAGSVFPDPVTQARYLPIATAYRTKNPNPMWRQDEDGPFNARLIAQAPAMAAVLEKVAEMYENTDAPLGIEARRILREARGEE